MPPHVRTVVTEDDELALRALELALRALALVPQTIGQRDQALGGPGTLGREGRERPLDVGARDR
ncbi:MAG: hypothetical protein KA129_08320 [Microthrixaceae bacterium]|nr:hypothetical protein [Microthrixaceae bacterium]